MQENNNQLRLLSEIPAQNIASGCDIPLSLFSEYVRHGSALVEMGAGTGAKAELIKNIRRCAILALDINPLAVEQTKQRGFVSTVSDVRRFEVGDWDRASLMLLEHMSGVYAEGVLCNQQGDDWKKVLTSADIFLQPEGHLLFADVSQARFDKQLIPYFGDPHLVEVYNDAWYGRYERNQQAAERLGIGINYGEFMVAKMGEHKDLEWGNVDDLVQLFDSPYLERWAQHLDRFSVLNHLQQLGLKTVEEHNMVYFSRTGMPLNGWVVVCQKGERFKYYPWYAGHTEEERLLIEDDRKRAVFQDPNYWDDWAQKLAHNLPDARKFFPSMFR